MEARILSLIISLVLFSSFGVCQTQENGCNEKAGSPQTLLVFIGELLHAKQVSARQDVNEARFAATYRIIEKICGNYTGDTISFDVIQVDYDSSFKRNKYHLLMLTKDTGQNEHFVLWANLYFDVSKTVNKQWMVTYMPIHDFRHAGQKALKPNKVRFSRDAFYDTKGMTREEIDLSYPEPYYKIKKDKAIPLSGNSIDEIFKYQREGTLASVRIYDQPVDTTDHPMVVQDVELENIREEEDTDSAKQSFEIAYLAIKDSLAKDPFNETKIQQLITNCRRQEDYSRCSLFFENLIQDYPDSVKAYLVNAKSRPWASLEDSSRIHFLQQALKVDSNNYDANYHLALSYYRLFQQQPTSYYASSARKWFIRCIDIDKAELVLLKYPVIQLSSYLDDSISVGVYNSLSYQVSTNEEGVPVANTHNWYFPVEPFLRDSKWITDYSVDMIRELRSAKFRLDWFSEVLAWFNEPILSSGYKGKMYRFLWQRAFHEPIVIKLQRNKRNVIISWKVPRIDDSLTISESAMEFKKSLTVSQWKKFEKSLTTVDYWSMISGDYSSSSADGSMWMLEAAIDGRYKVTFRKGHVYPKYTNSLMYLIKLTDLNLPEDKIY